MSSKSFATVSAWGDGVSNLEVVITMAGAGSRFRKAGFDMPKYMIEARGRTLFQWSMDSLSDMFDKASGWTFVVQRSDCSKGFIEEHCRNVGIDKIEIIELDGLTDGQATTCMHAVEGLDCSSSVLVYNIDTYVEPGSLLCSELIGDGSIPCFRGPGDHWSFVRVNDSGHAIEVKEKVRISDYCSIGAYWFSSARLFSDLYSRTSMAFNERYIAPMFNVMINDGLDVSVPIIGTSKVHVLGTPEELIEFDPDIRRGGFRMPEALRYPIVDRYQ